MLKYYSSIESFDKIYSKHAVYNNVRTWVIQEKVDGMNMSIVFDPSKKDITPENLNKLDRRGEWVPNPEYKRLGLRGRTDKTEYDFSKVTLPSYDEFYDAFDGEKKLTYVFFGELCGGGIQKKWYFDKPTFVLFDVQVVGPNTTFFLDPMVIPSIAKKTGLQHVPILGMTEQIVDSQTLLSDWIVSSHLNHNVGAEGIVAKPLVEMNDKFGNRIIYKTRYVYFS